MKKLSIYIHIPFCKSKCAYCDFLSFAERDIFFNEYYEVLMEEIKLSAYRYKEYKIATIFIGGGTPSSIPAEYITKIMQSLFEQYCIKEDAEITIEANPESATYEKLLAYKKCGINRISFGVQSFDDTILKRIGRAHDTEQFMTAFNTAREIGFENINFDLMFGLPDQSYEAFVETVKTAVKLNPEHISCYGLILEPGAKFYEDKNLVLPDEDTEMKMYNFAKKHFEGNGYKQYEISNYSKAGFQSRHNMAYWSNEEYLSFGLGAHSYVNNTRYHNTDDFDAYLNKDFEQKDVEHLSLNDRYAEFMFVGMRKIDGVSEEHFAKTFGVSIDMIYKDVLDKHEKNGLLERENAMIRLSEKGIYLSNVVFVDFLL